MCQLSGLGVQKITAMSADILTDVDPLAENTLDDPTRVQPRPMLMIDNSACMNRRLHCHHLEFLTLALAVEVGEMPVESYSTRVRPYNHVVT
eukprot:COSAG02_NODE_2398_length_8949_cov_423.229944_2_plen_92_part_00